jgi:alkylation response protein AidB-like acyl-CoA dehydrogenase
LKRNIFDRLHDDYRAVVKDFLKRDGVPHVIDTCLQLHRGYGYMEETPIARQGRDARVRRIYDGTNEIRRGIVGRSLGL